MKYTKMSMLLLVLLSFSFVFVSALDETKQYSDYPLQKTGQQFSFCLVCSSASYITLGDIMTPNGTEFKNVNMTFISPASGYCYNYTPQEEGDYVFNGISDACVKNFKVTVPVTKFGREGDSKWIIEMILWMLSFPLIYFTLIKKQSIPIYKLIGYVTLVIDSIIGLTLMETILGWITLMISMILVFKYLRTVLELDMPKEFR